MIICNHKKITNGDRLDYGRVYRELEKDERADSIGARNTYNTREMSKLYHDLSGDSVKYGTHPADIRSRSGTMETSGGRNATLKKQ